MDFLQETGGNCRDADAIWGICWFLRWDRTFRDHEAPEPLALHDDIDLPDPRSTVPKMAELSERLPKLNLEPAATRAVLDEELIARRTVGLT